MELFPLVKASHHFFRLLDAVMREPVIMEQDDVEVLNKPAAAEIYQTSPSSQPLDEM